LYLVHKPCPTYPKPFSYNKLYQVSVTIDKLKMTLTTPIFREAFMMLVER